MNHEKILWTVLPNGLITSGGTKYLRLTVAVSPRLYAGPGTQLGNWPYFQEWPSTLETLTFKFTFAGGSTATLTGMPDPTPNWPTADLTIWEYLFGATTPVVPYAFQDWSKRFIQTMPATQVYGFLKGQYQEIIAKFGALPPTFNQLQSVISRKESLDQFPSLSEYQDYVKEAHSGKTFRKPANSEEALLQSQIFYHRGFGFPDGQSKDGDGYKYAKPWPTTGQSLDFHQQVGGLTRFWELQRRLGLAVDLVVPFADVPSGDGSVTMVAPAGLSQADHITPQTMYKRTAAKLALASKTGSLHAGLLDINGANFTVAQIDIDGAAIKFVGLIRQLSSSAEYAYQTQARTKNPVTNSLPALRSGGLGLFEQGRASDLATFLPTAASNNSTAESGGGSSLKFYAEDLLQGYRVDIWDSHTSKWHSLHLRSAALDPNNSPSTYKGSYEFLQATGNARFWDPTFADEGLVSMGMTSDPNGPNNGGPGPDVYLHELVARWMGWSLAAQRPNLFVGLDGDPSTYDAEDSSDGSNSELLTHFGAQPHSVPKLRFGRGYRMRARTVDISANSLSPAIPDATFETPPHNKPPFVYRRFEPVPPPAVILHDSLVATATGIGSPGESTHRLVIRSNFNKSPNQELAFLRGTGAGQLGYTSLPPQTSRWIVPPQMSQLLAEHHGMFDDGAGWRSDALSLMTGHDSTFGTDGVSDVVLNNLPATLPYLGDALSAGASLEFLPGAGIIYGPGKLAFTGTWPDLRGFLLSVAGIKKGLTKPPHWDAVHRILTVFVPQADMVQNAVTNTWDFPKTNLSSYLSKALKIGSNNPVDTRELMGIMGWLEEYEAAGGLKPGQLTLLKELALFGLMWALTPSQELTFIHATQQPLVKPTWHKLESVRLKLGGTDTLVLSAPMAVDGHSTVKADVTAVWVDPRDDLSLDPCPQPNTTTGSPAKVVPGLPKQLQHQAHVVEIPIEPGDTSIAFTGKKGYLHNFGDTKHHWVDYTTTTTSRFTEYFPTDPNVPTTRAVTVKKVNVLSSARPQSPNILYAIPAFNWDTTTKPKIVETIRLGGMLRVYLDRPFYSSGPDELLGVVLINNKRQIDVVEKSRVKRAMAAHGLARNDNSGVVTVLEKYVTQWGMDPLWVSPPILNPPMLEDFPSAAVKMSGLYLDELGGRHGKTSVPVSVAGFPVTYDDTRCMYFCDIPFVWGDAYYPFVRLALTAFQPWSMSTPDTVHLSRVIVNDFVQIAPHRLAAVQLHSKASDPKFVKLTVAGVTSGGSDSTGTYMEVTVEQQAPQIGTSPTDELAWVPVPNLDYILTPSKIPKSDLTEWTVGFDVPHPVGSVPFRLIVREYELYPREWGSYVYAAPPPPSVRKDAAAIPMDKRLVYAATLQI